MTTIVRRIGYYEVIPSDKVGLVVDRLLLGLECPFFNK